MKNGTDKLLKKSERMKIRILGVGNGGCNILDDIQKDEYYADATFVYCDDNADDLNKHGKRSDCKFLLNMEQPNDFLFADESMDLTIIASALGGRTTSTFTAQITEACRKQSKMVLGVIAMPFATEGQQCVDTAKQALEALNPLYDVLLIQYNDQIPGNLLISDANDPLCSGLKRLCLSLKVYDLNALSIADTI